MKHAILFLVVAATVSLPAGLSLALADGGSVKRSTSDAALDAARVKRGEYLVTAVGCSDCHTPWHLGPNGPEPDLSRGLSGHPAELVVRKAPALPDAPWGLLGSGSMTAWAGPWGVSFAANLTPDAETGIGEWTEREFVAAIRTGRHRGMGRPVLPPMPSPNYANFSDEDLASIYAYLKSRPAVPNRVPEPLAPAATPGS